MRKNLLLFVAVLTFSISYGQGSLIEDIMNVESVTLEETEENEKLKAEYDETLEKETANLDEALADLDEDYQKEVSGLVEDFTKLLSDGDEKIVMNEKKGVVTKVKSLTMSHKKNKKDAVQGFLNAMQIANRSLPKFYQEDAQKEVKETASTHLESFETEYTANSASVKSFEQKEHLIIKNQVGTSSTSSATEGN